MNKDERIKQIIQEHYREMKRVTDHTYKRVMEEVPREDQEAVLESCLQSIFSRTCFVISMMYPLSWKDYSSKLLEFAHEQLSKYLTIAKELGVKNERKNKSQ